MSDFCFICHCPTTISDIQTHFCTESATISGKSILNIANDILALSDIDVTSITCQLCFEIVDEIDAFDHSLAQAKKKLQDRYFTYYGCYKSAKGFPAQNEMENRIYQVQGVRKVTLD